MSNLINISKLDAKEIKDQIEKELEEAFLNPERIKLLLDDLIWVSKKTNIFTKYSLNNAMLLSAQRKNLTEIKTYNAWQKEGVTVNKGEKALYVLSPVKICFDHKIASLCPNSCTSSFYKYKKQPLFDATQTNLVQEKINELVDKNIANNTINPQFNELVDMLKKTKNFDLEFALSKNGEGGYTNGKKIVISADLNPELKYSVLLHEFGHIYFEHPTDNLGYKGHIRGIKETEAEMFSWISTKILDLENEYTKKESANYINGWTRATKEQKPMNSFAKVFNSVTKVFFKPDLNQQLDLRIEEKENTLEAIKELKMVQKINPNLKEDMIFEN